MGLLKDHKLQSGSWIALFVFAALVYAGTTSRVLWLGRQRVYGGNALQSGEHWRISQIFYDLTMISPIDSRLSVQSFLESNAIVGIILAGFIMTTVVTISDTDIDYALTRTGTNIDLRGLFWGLYAAVTFGGLWLLLIATVLISVLGTTSKKDERVWFRFFVPYLVSINWVRAPGARINSRKPPPDVAPTHSLHATHLRAS